MSLTSAVFLLGAIIFGGFIAYLGDLLGSHIGKKRISLFKLRPRYTARVATVGVGMLIPLLTILVILAGSSEVRQWLADGPRLIQQRDEMTQKMSTLSKEQSALILDRDELQRQNADKIKQKAAIEKQLMLAQANFNKQASLMRGLNAKYSALQSRSAALSSKLGTLQAKLTATLAKISSVQAKFAEATRNMAMLRTTTSRLEAENAIFGKKNTQLGLDNKKLGDQAKKLTSDIESLTIIRDEVARNLEDVKRELANVNHQLDTTKLQLDQTQAQLQQSENLAGLWKGGYLYAREEEMVYRRSQEVARLSVGTGSGQRRADTALSKLLQISKAKAIEQGCADVSGWDAATLVGSDTQRQQVIDSINKHNGDVLLIAKAWQNTFRKEPVALIVDVRDNPLVYKAGQVITSASVDTSHDRATLIQDIQTLLSDQLSQKVRKDGMVPVVGTGESVGEVSLQQFSLLIENLLAQGNRKVRVNIMAAEDTHAAGPLKIEFSIK